MKNRIKYFLAQLLLKILNSGDEKSLINFFESLKSKSQKKGYDSFRNKYNISKSFLFNGSNILFYGNGLINCGDNSYIGSFSTIQSYNDCVVTIGRNCSISHNVRIYTVSNVADQDFLLNSEKSKKSGNVVIGNGVWIGANVFINQGIEIGDNVVVGANSVVTKSLKENGIYGGVPAKLLKYKNI